ncbi:MAG: class I SAM-dependent DNA methyltransferase [Nocardioides sp.]|uniref:class I SAM-dependent DNA methyltransferase n=1 Tax=Nocardioides sp. TaxID=35761 RepID=UPI003F128154
MDHEASGRDDRADVRATYDTVAKAYARWFPGTEPEQAADLEMVARFVASLPAAGRVLDAGCGTGRMLPLLAGAGREVVGVDLSPAMLAGAALAQPEHGLACADLGALPFRTGTFDGVFAWYSTIHGDEAALRAACAEARRVLRPGGLLLVAFQVGSTVHDTGATYRRLGYDVALRRYDRTPDQVALALHETGFHEVDRMERGAMGSESTGQAVLVARAG